MSFQKYHLIICSDGSRPSDKGGGPGHPDPEIRGARSQKKIFRPFGSHFGLKMRGGGWAPGPLTWICHGNGWTKLSNIN